MMKMKLTATVPDTCDAILIITADFSFGSLSTYIARLIVVCFFFKFREENGARRYRPIKGLGRGMCYARA